MVIWKKRFCEKCGEDRKHRIDGDKAICWTCVSMKNREDKKVNNSFSNIEKNPELSWKDEMREILDGVGITSPYSNSMDTYNDLIRGHKRIFEENHDSKWGGTFGTGVSRAQLDTYLLIKIHNMMKGLMEGGAELRSSNKNKDEYEEKDTNKDGNTKNNSKKWIPKEDFKKIEFSELPREFIKDIDRKYVCKSLINSEGIYRVEIKDEPFNHKGLKGTHGYMLDYNPNL